MAKVKQVVTDAFEDIVVSVAEAAIEQDDARTAIRALNTVMAGLASDSINIGYTVVNSVDDVLTVPDGAIDAIVSILAFRLWPKYKKGEPTRIIAVNARNAVKLLTKISASMASTEYPSTLPIGSGNYCGVNDDVFYQNLESTILTENNGAVSLEDDTDE